MGDAELMTPAQLQTAIDRAAEYRRREPSESDAATEWTEHIHALLECQRKMAQAAIEGQAQPGAENVG